jgi:hypothetical protein
MNTWLGYFRVFPIVCTMHSLDTVGATDLETHLGCGVLFLLPLLVGICRLFDGMNVLEER